MSTLRRIFSAPGNARVWLSLTFYASALAAILIYSDRIGKKAAEAFQELTAPPDAGVASAPAPSEEDRIGESLKLAPGARERALLELARGGSEGALRSLDRLLHAKNPVAPAAVVALAREVVEEGPRALRAVAAGLLLTAEKIALDSASLSPLRRALRRKDPDGKVRIKALERIGWLGLSGVESAAANKDVLRLLRSAKILALRAEAARALGRIADASFHAPLLARIADREPPALRAAAVSALVDLGLAGGARRSRILRALAAALADRVATGAHAESVWRALRILAAEGKSLEGAGPQRLVALPDGGVEGARVESDGGAEGRQRTP